MRKPGVDDGATSHPRKEEGDGILQVDGGAGFLPSARRIVASCLVVCCFAYGQAAYPNQEVRVHDLPPLTARSTDASDVLTTSLEIAFHDKQVCCGKNSALENSVQASDPKTLKDIASNLQGKHLLGAGRPIMVEAEYLALGEVNSGQLVSVILNQHPPLMEWNSHVYVVHGVIFEKTVDYPSGAVMYAIHKFLLWDARFSDSRREVSFDRVTDDTAKVQGLLFLQAKPQ